MEDKWIDKRDRGKEQRGIDGQTDGKEKENRRTNEQRGGRSKEMLDG